MNSKKSHFSIISLSVLAYFPIYEYWKSLHGIELYFSKYIAQITSLSSSKGPYEKAVLTSESFGIHEDFTVISLMFLLAVIPLLPLPLYHFKRKVFGGFQSNSSVVAASIGVSFALLFHTGKLLKNGL